MINDVAPDTPTVIPFTDSSTDQLTGTSGDDNFSGVLDADGSGSTNTTWQVSDSIDGGGGTDRLDVQVIADDGGDDSFSGRTSTSVERMFFTHTDGDNNLQQEAEIDTSNFSDLEQLWSEGGTASENVDDGDALTFNTIADGVTVGIEGGDSDLDINFNFDAGSAQTLALKGASADDVSFTGDTVTNLTVATSGGASTLESLGEGNNNLTDVTITGGQDVTTEITGFDGNADTINVTGGAGAETLTLGLADAFSVNAGDGEDRVNAILNGTSLTTDFSAENLETFIAANISGGESVDLTNVSGVDTLGLAGNNGSTITFNNVEDGDTVVFVGEEAEGSGTAADIGNITVGSFANSSNSDPASSLNVEINNQGNTPSTSNNDVAINAGALQADNVTSISVNAADDDASIASIADNSNNELENLTLTSSGNLTVDTALANNTPGFEDTLTSVDASGVSGDLTLGLGATITAGAAGQDGTLSNSDDVNATFTYTGAAGADALTVADQNKNLNGSSTSDPNITLDINTGEGGDTVDLGDVGNSGDSDVVLDLSLGAANDTVTGTGGSNGITLGNSDHAIDFGAGSDTLDSSGAGDTLDLTNAEVSGLENVIVDNGNNVRIAAGDLRSNGSNSNEITASEFNGNFFITATGTDDDINLAGGDFDNVTVQGGGADLQGEGGNNTLTGNGNANVINGDGGDDTIVGGAGNDTLDGGTGTADTLDLSGMTIPSGDTGVAIATAGAGFDLQAASFFGSSAEGSDGDKNIDAGNVEVINSGGSANSSQVDTHTNFENFVFGDGNDVFAAGDNGLTVTGGGGNDIIDLGSGDSVADTVIFEATGAENGEDTINNFSTSTTVDVLDFSAFSSGNLSIDQNGGGTNVINGFTQGSAGNVDITDSVVQVNDSGASMVTNVNTEAKIAGLIGSDGGTGSEDFDLADGGRALIIAGDEESAGNSAFVYFVDSTGDGDGTTVMTGDVTLVGTIGTVNVDDFVTDNIMV